MDVAAIIGYSDETLDPYTKSIIEEAIEVSKKLTDIKAIVKPIKKITLDNIRKCIRTENTTFDLGKTVFHYYKGSEFILVMACTAGKGIENHAKKCNRDGELIESYIFDNLGSIIVEKAGNKIVSELKVDAYKQNTNITNFYNPGHCEWDVSEQFKLFSFIESEFDHIKLTDSALMDPVKSVSGLIGVGKETKFRGYICDECKMKDCIYRKHKMASDAMKP